MGPYLNDPVQPSHTIDVFFEGLMKGFTIMTTFKVVVVYS